MEVSWEKGIKKIIIESDSKEAVDLAEGGCTLDHPLAPVVQKIREKMRVGWEVKLMQCFREGNSVANWLATTTLYASQEDQRLDEPSKDMSHILQRDLVSKGLVRWVAPSV